jgi:hypothetical protein
MCNVLQQTGMDPVHLGKHPPLVEVWDENANLVCLFVGIDPTGFCP